MADRIPGAASWQSLWTYIVGEQAPVSPVSRVYVFAPAGASPRMRRSFIKPTTHIVVRYVDFLNHLAGGSGLVSGEGGLRGADSSKSDK